MPEGTAVSGIAVGVDIGGTKLAAGLVSADGSVLDRVRSETPDTADRIVDAVVEVVEHFSLRHNLTAVPVGVGAAGLMSADGTVRFAPNLPWKNFPLRAELAGRLPGVVTVDNDANVAAWGEYRFGAGRNAHESMVMLTVGTGVGGGLVLGDRLLRGDGGMAGELGHLAVLEGGPECPCGATGCLEALASGTAIARFAREARQAGSIAATSPLGSIPIDDITGKEVTIAAHAGDPDALDLLTAAGRWLGVGIASMIAAFDPEIVVIGGGAMQAGHLLLEPAIAAAGERLIGRGYRELCPIVAAELGDDAGMVGAAALAVVPTPR